MMKRLFFALWPDQTIRQRCFDISKQLHGAGLRPINPNNFHITLVFLGNVDNRTEAILAEAATSITVPRLSITIDCLEFWRKPQVLCLTGQSNPKLLTLVSFLSEISEAQSIVIDRRPYIPHITIARKARAKPNVEFEPILWHSDSFCLVQSSSSRQGSAYHIVREWPDDKWRNSPNCQSDNS
jgi:2'-5' RNA ligase